MVLTQGTFPVNYFLISLVLNALFLVAAVTLFKVMFERSRAKGLSRLE